MVAFFWFPEIASWQLQLKSHQFCSLLFPGVSSILRLQHSFFFLVFFFMFFLICIFFLCFIGFVYLYIFLSYNFIFILAHCISYTEPAYISSYWDSCKAKSQLQKSITFYDCSTEEAGDGMFLLLEIWNSELKVWLTCVVWEVSVSA